jgi:cation:H+ antiporter
MNYLILVIGLALLLKGADLFVDGSSKIARMLNVSPLLIGLTIVAFGTSSPEATVSILAALDGSSDISLGNVVGSNIFNITLVVGITAFINPLKVESETVRKEIPFTLLASIALLVLISDVSFQGFNINLLTRADGLIFILFFSIFMYYIFEMALSSRKNEGSTVEVIPTKGQPWLKNSILTILGLGAIILGGEFVVRSATDIAIRLGMSETLVGLTIVAVGTSLPELITSITAALKKQSEIALGNIVGSCIFNILFVLGISATISPLIVSDKIFSDVSLMIVLTLILLVFSSTNYKIGKREGSFLTIAYIIYMIFIIVRN